MTSLILCTLHLLMYEQRAYELTSKIVDAKAAGLADANGVSCGLLQRFYAIQTK